MCCNSLCTKIHSGASGPHLAAVKKQSCCEPNLLCCRVALTWYVLTMFFLFASSAGRPHVWGEKWWRDMLSCSAKCAHSASFSSPYSRSYCAVVQHVLPAGRCLQAKHMWKAETARKWGFFCDYREEWAGEHAFPPSKYYFLWLIIIHSATLIKVTFLISQTSLTRALCHEANLIGDRENKKKN